MRNVSLFSLFSVLLVSLVSVGCGATARRVETGIDEEGWRGYRTFALAGRSDTPEGYTVTPLTPEIESAVVERLRVELTSHGYVESPAESADLLVWGATGRALREVSPARTPALVRMGFAGNIQVPEGTLVLDLLDRRSGQHVWHGQVEGAVNAGQVNEGLIADAVRQLVTHLPAPAAESPADETSGDEASEAGDDATDDDATDDDAPLE
jgi:hypothetical protein